MTKIYRIGVKSAAATAFVFALIWGIIFALLVELVFIYGMIQDMHKIISPYYIGPILILAPAIFGLAFGAIASLLYNFVFKRFDGLDLKIVSSNISKISFWSSLKVGLIFGLVFGILASPIPISTPSLFIPPALGVLPGIIFGMIFGIIFSIIYNVVAHFTKGIRFEVKALKISKIDILSVAKIGLVFGLIFGIAFGLLGGPEKALALMQAKNYLFFFVPGLLPLAVILVIITSLLTSIFLAYFNFGFIGAMLFGIIFGLIFGFIFSVISALIYNILAKFTGGIEIKVKK